LPAHPSYLYRSNINGIFETNLHLLPVDRREKNNFKFGGKFEIELKRKNLKKKTVMNRWSVAKQAPKRRQGVFVVVVVPFFRLTTTTEPIVLLFLLFFCELEKQEPRIYCYDLIWAILDEEVYTV
jgi:hypothetical protein